MLTGLFIQFFQKTSKVHSNTRFNYIDNIPTGHRLNIWSGAHSRAPGRNSKITSKTNFFKIMIITFTTFEPKE